MFDVCETFSTSPGTMSTDGFPVPVVVTTPNWDGTGRDEKNMKYQFMWEVYIVKLCLNVTGYNSYEVIKLSLQM